jgi:ABC-2 type transport system permease protein
MIRRIMKHEWRLLAADSTAWAVIALFAAAVGCGVWGGARWVRFQQRTLDALAVEESDRLRALQKQVREAEAKFVTAGMTAKPAPAAPPEEWGPRSPYFVGGYRGLRYAYLPPAPLALTAVGQSDLYPYYFKVSTDFKENFASVHEIENPLKLLVGRFDLAFVLIYLYPLLILALSFNLVAGEKEGGTLHLLLAQPVRLRTVVTGKAAVRALIAFGSVLVFGTVGFVIGGARFVEPGAWARYGLWAAAVLAYGAFWFALAAFVNAWGRSAATNAMTLAAAWLAFVVVLPCVAGVAASALYPVPSRVEYIRAMRRASEGEVAARSKIMAAFYEDHPELAKGNAVSRREEFAITKEKLNQRTAELLRPLNEKFETHLARQQAFVGLFRFLSPAVLMQEALYDIAGTGAARYRHFGAQADEFHRAWKAHFNPRIAARAAVSAADYDGFPRYEYREEMTSDVVARVGVPLVALLVPTLLLGALSWRAYRGYRALR